MTKLLALIVGGISAATAVSGFMLYLELDSNAGPFLRDELRHYALVFCICYALILFGGELAGKRGVLVGILIAGIVYVVMMPAPKGDLSDDFEAQMRLDDLHNWLEWTLAIALAASARWRFDTVVKAGDAPHDRENQTTEEHTSVKADKSQSKANEA